MALLDVGDFQDSFLEALAIVLLVSFVSLGMRAGIVVAISVPLVLAGVFAGLATLVYATQLRVIQSTSPTGLELTIITASVVGGVSILGGAGTVVGSTLAAILIAEITSALVFVNVSPYWTDALRGGLILATVIADIMRRRRRAARGWKT